MWCILLIIWFVSVHGPAECEGAWRYDVGVGGLLAAFVLSLGLELAMVSAWVRGMDGVVPLFAQVKRA